MYSISSILLYFSNLFLTGALKDFDFDVCESWGFFFSPNKSIRQFASEVGFFFNYRYPCSLKEIGWFWTEYCKTLLSYLRYHREFYHSLVECRILNKIFVTRTFLYASVLPINVLISQTIKIKKYNSKLTYLVYQFIFYKTFRCFSFSLHRLQIQLGFPRLFTSACRLSCRFSWRRTPKGSYLFRICT